jgi:hypothetical protein
LIVNEKKIKKKIADATLAHEKTRHPKDDGLGKSH